MVPFSLWLTHGVYQKTILKIWLIFGDEHSLFVFVYLELNEYCNNTNACFSFLCLLICGFTIKNFNWNRIIYFKVWCLGLRPHLLWNIAWRYSLDGDHLSSTCQKYWKNSFKYQKERPFRVNRRFSKEMSTT